MHPEDAARTTVLRKINAANVFSSYLLTEFYSNDDNWSILQGWTITASHVAWSASKHRLSEKLWERPFNLAKSGALTALENFAREGRQAGALRPPSFELDDVTRTRNTITSSAIAAWELVSWITAGEPSATAGDAMSIIRNLVKERRLSFWGESATPHWLCIMWFLAKFSGDQTDESLLLSMIALIAHRNHFRSNTPLKGPYTSADDTLAENISRAKEQQHDEKPPASESYSLESLVMLATRRMLRTTLRLFWYNISKVEYARFVPVQPNDLLLWKCSSGRESTSWPGSPQSWRALQRDAYAERIGDLPTIFVGQPEFALLFSLVYPHRLNPALTHHLDLKYYFDE